jgi:hypothetical protein
MASIWVFSLGCAPLFPALTIDDPSVKNTSDFYLTPVNLLNSTTFNLIPKPLTFIFLLVVQLFVFSLTMKHAFLESTSVDRPIDEFFAALSIREVILERPSILTAIEVGQRSLAMLETISPRALIRGTVSPFATAVLIHLWFLPRSYVSPTCLVADKSTLSWLVSASEISNVFVSVGPGAIAMAVWKPVFEFANV